MTAMIILYLASAPVLEELSSGRTEHSTRKPANGAILMCTPDRTIENSSPAFRLLP